MNVTMRDIDGYYSSANMMGTANWIVPFEQTTEFIDVGASNGTFDIVQFSLSYNIPSKVENTPGKSFSAIKLVAWLYIHNPQLEGL